MINLTIKKRNLLVALYAFSIFFSFFYIPVEVSGTAVSTKIIPVFLLGLVTLLCMSKGLFRSGWFYVIIFSAALPLFGSIQGLGSLIYFGNYFLLSVLVFSSVYSFLLAYGGEGFNLLLRQFVNVGFLVGVAGILQFFYYESMTSLWFMIDTPYYESKGQVASMYSNPNIFGILTAMSMACLVAVRGDSKEKYSFLDYFIFGVLLFAVWVSGSRMALLIALLSVLAYRFYCLLYFRYAVGSIFVLMFLMTYSFGFVGGYVDLNFRGEIWSTSFDIFSDYFLFGVGLGQLQYKISEYSDVIDWVQSANNFYVGWLVESGLVSFLMMLFLLAVLFSRPCKRIVSISFVFLLLLVTQFSEYFIIYVGAFVVLFYTCLAYAVYLRVDKRAGL